MVLLIFTEFFTEQSLQKKHLLLTEVKLKPNFTSTFGILCNKSHVLLQSDAAIKKLHTFDMTTKSDN